MWPDVAGLRPEVSLVKFSCTKNILQYLFMFTLPWGCRIHQTDLCSQRAHSLVGKTNIGPDAYRIRHKVSTEMGKI